MRMYNCYQIAGVKEGKDTFSYAGKGSILASYQVISHSLGDFWITVFHIYTVIHNPSITDLKCVASFI